jgi:hypothetical protein
LLQAPSAKPNDTTRTIAHTLRMHRSPPRSLAGILQ